MMDLALIKQHSGKLDTEGKKEWGIVLWFGDFPDHHTDLVVG